MTYLLLSWLQDSAFWEHRDEPQPQALSGTAFLGKTGIVVVQQEGGVAVEVSSCLGSRLGLTGWDISAGLKMIRGGNVGVQILKLQGLDLTARMQSLANSL